MRQAAIGAHVYLTALTGIVVTYGLAALEWADHEKKHNDKNLD